MPPKELLQPVVKDNGERVVPGSRRPDGTYRQERRIRAGYTPQEEQPLYQSRGVLMRQNVPLVPGLDNEEVLSATKQGAMSKSAKKNEKRKEKKAESSPDNGAPPAPAAATSSQPASKATSQAPAAPPAEADTPEQALEKQVRALKKKLRQVEGLAQRQASGAALTPEEAEKLGKLSGWEQEVQKLEQELAKLKA